MYRRKGVRTDNVRGDWSAALDDGDRAFWQRCLEQASSIVISGDRKRCLATTLRSRMRTLSPEIFRNYAEHLDSGRNVWSEWQRPTSGVAVHAGASLRDKASRDFVKNMYRPNRLKEKRKGTRLRAWRSGLGLSMVCGAESVFCSFTLLISSTFPRKPWI
jgi:chemotaxis methyl-accepting protein methylase